MQNAVENGVNREEKMLRDGRDITAFLVMCYYCCFIEEDVKAQILNFSNDSTNNTKCLSQGTAIGLCDSRALALFIA